MVRENEFHDDDIYSVLKDLLIKSDKEDQSEDDMGCLAWEIQHMYSGTFIKFKGINVATAAPFYTKFVLMGEGGVLNELGGELFMRCHWSGRVVLAARTRT